jgi:signal transduction histidine kinase
MGLVELLSSLDPQSDDYQVTLVHLQTNTYQLDTVLQDMNTILAVRDTQDVAASELVPLTDVIEQARRTLEEPLQQCGGTLQVNLPMGLRVHGNRAYLYSIFFNLLANSIKYRAETRPLQVEVQGISAEDGVRISFADNGSGFDVEKAGSDVFKLYKRFHTQQAGRGMGLYLVKNHVEAMNGRIEVSSQVNVGTRFTIHLR